MLTILVLLVIFGVVLYIIFLLPMNDTVRKIVYAVALLVIVLWLLSALGLPLHLGKLK